MKQTLKYILEKLLQLRKFAEDKHSITIALASAVTVFFASFIESRDTFILFLSSLSIIFSLISVISSFFALMAKRVRTQTKKSASDGDLVDYKNICKFDSETYLKTMIKQYGFEKTYKIDDFDRDLARQIISTAKVIKQKLSFFNISLVFLGLGLILGVVVVCILGGVWQCWKTLFFGLSQSLKTTQFHMKLKTFISVLWKIKRQ